MLVGNLRANGAMVSLIERLSIHTMRPHTGIHTNGVLPKEAWLELDNVVLGVLRDELNGIADLMSLGLTHGISDLGTTVSEWQRLSDMSDSQIDMGADTEGEEDAHDFQMDGVPVPIIHKSFRLNIRELLASMRAGQGLDTLQAETAARKNRDALERLLFKGTKGLTSGGYTNYGYTNHPQTLTVTASSLSSGDFATEGNAYKAAQGIIAHHEDRGYRGGPYGLYIARTQYQQLRNRYSDGSGQTELQAIQENLGFAFVKASDELADGELCSPVLRRDSVDLGVVNLAGIGDGGDVAVVSWLSMGGMIEHFKVLLSMVPRIKRQFRPDGTEVNGVVIVTGA